MLIVTNRAPGINPATVSRFFCWLVAISVCLGGGCATASAAADAEPTYYIYHGKQKLLELDPAHVALRTISRAGETLLSDALPEGLAARGFNASDVVGRPASGWMILNVKNALPASPTSAQSTPKQSQGRAIHALIASLLDTGDPSIQFVSPVFRDERGGPVLVTPRLLLGFKQNFSPVERQRLLASVPEGASLEKMQFPQPHDQRWQLRSRDGFAVLARANSLAQTAGVDYAEPDMIITGYPDFFPSDPGFSQSWGLRNFGQLGGVTGFDMDAISAWDISFGSASVIVLVMDVGVQQDHPDINQVPGRDFTPDAPRNPHGGPYGTYDSHGTAVAGCISERINNSLGSAGIAPGVKVASARCGGLTKSDGSFSTDNSWFADALYWGQSLGARVSNNSNHLSVGSSALESAYNSTRANGMIHFASAGNSATSLISYPASIPSVNAVGEANRFGQRSAESQYGPGLKFMAPGDSIFSTDRTGNAGYVKGDYVIASGTSFASPYAAGIAALLISRHPGITPDQIESIMESTCTDMGPAGYETGYGYGLVNAFRALSAPIPTPTPVPTPTPTPSPTPSAKLANISTRLSVQTGDNVLIGGFIITGTGPKEVMIRGLGPSLSDSNVPDALQDPTLELHIGNSIVTNDDWPSDSNAAQIPSGFAPTDSRESVLVRTLLPGAYTVIEGGKEGTTGVGLVELYDLDTAASSQMVNISTRGLVQTGANALIGGFITLGGSQTSRLIVRAIGPSLSQAGIGNAVPDPTLELHNSNGAIVASNDNWQDSQAAEIQATGVPPSNSFEAAIVVTLPAGSYTAIVAEKNGTTGVGLVEIYKLQ